MALIKVVESVGMNSVMLARVSANDRADVAMALRWRDAVESSGLGLWQWHHATGRWLCSDACAAMLGCTDPAQPLPPADLPRIHPDDRRQARQDLQAHLAGETAEYRSEVRVRHADGHHLWILIRGRIVSHETDGRPGWIVGTYSNIDERKRGEAARAAAEQQFHTTFADAPIGMALVSLDGHWLEVNGALCHFLGYARDELLRSTFQDITHPDDLEADLSFLNELLAGMRQHYGMEKRYFHKAGHIVHVQLDVSLVRRDGRPDYFISQIQDISARKHIEAQLASEKELAQVTLASIGDGVIRTDTDGIIRFCNAAAATLLGVSSTAIEGHAFNAVVRHYRRNGQDNDRRSQALLQRADGEMIPIEDHSAPIRDSCGSLIGSVFVFRDVTRARALANELQFQAHHDSLTGLPNRREFEQALADRLASARSGRSTHTLLYLDLDRFKLINDSCGHAAGDTVLCAISTLMRRRLRSHDLLARLGGDEFGAILSDCTAFEAKAIAESLVAAVDHYCFIHDGRTHRIGISIGLTTIDEQAGNLNTLLSQADTACYIAKRRGRSRVQCYQRDDIEVTRTESDVHWINRIDAAMTEGRLEVYGQCILDSATGAISGYETLMRMRERSGEILLPGAMLAAARRFGHTTRLDRWMVVQVHNLLAQHQQNFSGYLTVNLSGLSLSDADFSDYLLALLDGHQVPPERLRFEITETDAFTSCENAATLVKALRTRGYRILLDDFGSGFLSFEQLRSLSADGLKIDQIYTRNLGEDALNRTIIDSICRISRHMGLEVIAEGVKDEASLTVLRELGVQRVQGHLFHVAEPLRNRLAANTVAA